MSLRYRIYINHTLYAAFLLRSDAEKFISSFLLVPRWDRDMPFRVTWQLPRDLHEPLQSRFELSVTPMKGTL